MCTGSRQVTTESKVKGALRRKWLYVGRIYGPNVTENDIKEFLQDSTGTDDFDVKKLPTKGNNSSFSIGVHSDEMFLKLFKSESWPSGVILREFNFRNFFRKDPVQITTKK